MAQNYGSARLVVGAHYGVRDWLSQRVTAALMALFTILLLARLLLSSGPIGYDLWASIFAPQWMKALTFAVIVSLAVHAWVGMRNVWRTTSKQSAPVCCCKFSPSSGWSAALAGRCRSCGACNPGFTFCEQRLNP